MQLLFLIDRTAIRGNSLVLCPILLFSYRTTHQRYVRYLQVSQVRYAHFHVLIRNAAFMVKHRLRTQWKINIHDSSILSQWWRVRETRLRFDGLPRISVLG